MRVFITGGTGLVGRRLIPTLRQQGHEVVLLTRSPRVSTTASGTMSIHGDPTQAGTWQEEIARCDAVINLAGENLFAHRWNAEQKRHIRDSRVLATRHVVDAIGRSAGRCGILVNASAVGYYGHRGDQWLDEDSPPGQGFLSEVCVAWEAEAQRAAETGTRVVRARFGVVLDPAGGALATLLPVFRWFLGGPTGDGRQWMSWIHYQDLVDMLILSLTRPNLEGALNAVSPEPVTSRHFAQELGRIMNRPSLIRVPSALLKLTVGGGADVVLASQRVRPHVASKHGYPFAFQTLDAALDNMLST